MKAYTYKDNVKFEFLEKEIPVLIEESVGSKVSKFKAGDRVTINVETFCGDFFFCKNGYVNNCTDKNCGQADFVRVPIADNGLNKIPDNVSFDGSDCDDILKLIENKLIDTTPLITHTYELKSIEKAYNLFENKLDNVIKVAIKC